MNNLIPLDKYLPWNSKQLNQKIVGAGNHGYLTFGDLCKGTVTRSRYCDSRKSPAQNILANSLMSNGYGWFGLSTTPRDITEQLQWAYDAGRVIFDEKSGEVSGGVYILGDHSEDLKSYSVTGKDGKEVVLRIRDTQINFFEAAMAMAEKESWFYKHVRQLDPLDEIAAVVSTICTTADMVFRRYNSGIKESMLCSISQLLQSLLTIIYSCKQHLDIDEVHSMLISLPTTVEDVEDAGSDWKSSYFGKFMSEHLITPRIQSQISRNLCESISYCLKVFPSLASDTKSTSIAVLGSVLDSLRRDPLHAMMFSETSVSPETIRQGNIFICGLSLMTHGDAARMAGILYKSIFQRTLAYTQCGKGAVIWGEDEKNMEDDSLFRAEAVNCRTVSVYMTNTLARNIDFQVVTRIINSPLVRLKNAVFGLLRRK